MIDQTDLEIIRCLQINSRLQWKEIGQKVHLTGQAVAARIRKMEDLKVIKGFTVNIDLEKLGQPITALVTVFMKTTDHQSFQRFINNTEAIAEAHRVSGDGCYWLKLNVTDQEKLNQLLDEILKFGVYRVNLSIGKVK